MPGLTVHENLRLGLIAGKERHKEKERIDEIAERAKTQGFRVDARGPKDFAVFLKSEVERWGKVIVAAKITAE